MKKNRVLERIRKYRSEYVDIFVDYTFDLSHRIQFLLECNSMEQKDLAKALGKSESEISKWLSGSHNFTLKTIAKIEAVLGDKLLEVKAENNHYKNQKIGFYFLQQKQIFTPDHLLKENNSKKYSPGYVNSVIADC